MSTKREIPKGSLYHYSKQVRDIMDAKMAAEDRVEAMEEKAREKIENEKEKIEAQKNSQYAKRQNKLSLILIILGIVITVIIGVTQIIQALK